MSCEIGPAISTTSGRCEPARAWGFDSGRPLLRVCAKLEASKSAPVEIRATASKIRINATARPELLGFSFIFVLWNFECRLCSVAETKSTTILFCSVFETTEPGRATREREGFHL